MQIQTCLLQKSVKIYIYVNDISLISDLVYLCTKWTKKIHKNIQSNHLYTDNDPEEIYTGKHLELTIAQGASTETHTPLQNITLHLLGT
jgi:sensor c-di-GMP phosphodiesterase-like protein